MDSPFSNGLIAPFCFYLELILSFIVEYRRVFIIHYILSLTCLFCVRAITRNRKRRPVICDTSLVCPLTISHSRTVWHQHFQSMKNARNSKYFGKTSIGFAHAGPSGRTGRKSNGFCTLFSTPFSTLFSTLFCPLVTYFASPLNKSLDTIPQSRIFQKWSLVFEPIKNHKFLNGDQQWNAERHNNLQLLHLCSTAVQ